MNYRDYKIFAADGYYHIFNRGVDKMDIFKDAEDYKFFLTRMNENLFPAKAPIVAQRGPLGSRYIRKTLPPDIFSLICYCLMPNHFHFFIRQDASVPVGKLISKICTGYSKYFNKKYQRVGHVFQDAFKAVRVETDSQLLWLSAYIHQNPAVAGIVKNLKDYPWSSYPDYIGIRQGRLCKKDFILKQFGSPVKYEKFVNESFEKIKGRKDLEILLLEN